MIRNVLSSSSIARIVVGTATVVACLPLAGGTALAVRGPGSETIASRVLEPTQGRGFPGQSGGDVRPWWKDPEMVKAVGLTPAQVAKIDQIFEQRQRLLMPKFQDYRAQEAELNRMLRERTATPEEVEAHMRRLTYPYFDIMVSRVKMLYEISRVMTPEQNEKFKEIGRERRSRDQGRVGGGRPPGGN